MPRLISRDRPIPNGLRYYQSEIKFEARQHMSFRGVVEALIHARRANPHLVQKYGWSLDYETVANEVDRFNAQIAKDQGWTDYYMEGDPTGGNNRPFTSPPQHQPSPLRVAAGAKPVVEWLASGAEAVPQEQSAKRASVCAECPLNERGDFTRWFTVPVTEAIRAALSAKSQMKLSTPFDEQLQICSACLCPLKLKVHMPFSRIWPKLSQEAKDSLHPKCWILEESRSA